MLLEIGRLGAVAASQGTLFQCLTTLSSMDLSLNRDSLVSRPTTPASFIKVFESQEQGGAEDCYVFSSLRNSIAN